MLSTNFIQSTCLFFDAEGLVCPRPTSSADSYSFVGGSKVHLHEIHEWPSVLVSAGTELTLFLVAGIVLRFGFSVRMMLITC